MIKVDVAKTLQDLENYHKEVKRKLEYMVVGFAEHITELAVGNTPIGDVEKFAGLYRLREERLGLEQRAGFAKGSWQVNTSGQFSIQETYSGSAAISLAKTSLGSYKLGQTVYIGNYGYYIQALENGYSDQSPIGIMKPTTDQIMTTYQVDLKRLFEQG